jgi:3-oxoacyl-[acyl-carrier-protein] synthase-3
MSGVGFLGIGVGLPETVRTNDFWADRLASQPTDFLAIHDRPDVSREATAAMARAGAGDPFGGSKLRRVIADDEDPSDLEARAALAAIADAGLSPRDIDLVLVASLPSDRLIPSNGPAVQAKCGLVNASAWSLDVGCASLPPQLLTASALVRTGAARYVLVVQSQLGSRTVNPMSRNAPGFGDGAAAAVVGQVADGFGLLGTYMRTDGSFRDGIVLAPSRGGTPVRDFWHTCDGPPLLATFDPEMAKLAGVKGPELCRMTCIDALSAAGLTIDDVDVFVCNQSMAWFADACRLALALPVSKLVETFEEFANVGAAAVLLNLSVARSRGRLKSGDLVLMYSPAAGFTRSAAVVRWSLR